MPSLKIKIHTYERLYEPMKTDVQLINLEKSDPEKLIQPRRFEIRFQNTLFKTCLSKTGLSNQANCEFLKCCFAIIASRNYLTLHFK
jgi:hypothetical protein